MGVRGLNSCGKATGSGGVRLAFINSKLSSVRLSVAAGQS